MNKQGNSRQRTSIRQKFLDYIGGLPEFMTGEAVTGLLLIIFASIAMIWANTAGSDLYFDLLNMPFELKLGDWHLEEPLLLWINDGLMAFFFLYVGLEIKREVLVGELSEPGQISLPLFAAVGGMLVPAGLFLLLHGGQEGSNGWGIPMATDIAFSLGILILIGKRVPLSFKIFLTAFAIVDDIGAVLVIAFFYSHDLHQSYLYWGAGVYALLWILNILDVRRMGIYFTVGLVFWYFTLKSGIHPTVAGILIALAIPTNNRLRMDNFVRKTRIALAEFIDDKANSIKQYLSNQQLRAIDDIETNVDYVQPPLQRLEDSLHPYVNFFILPVFALANAGVVLGEGPDSFGTLTWHIAIALVAGKAIGIFGMSWIGVKTGLASLPEGCSWLQLFGLSLLGGVGFTMALFIAGLAFPGDALLNQAKVGILLGSLVAGLSGFFLLRYTFSRADSAESEAEAE